jgi:glycosyltransferase involved in cell wall biosynthesis
MCCFTNAETVEAAVLSVLGQTHRNLELVIVDDASTDASRAALAALAAQDPRIRVLFNTRNQGAYANRNRVWAESDAEFFCCLDADDIALPGRLAHQCCLLQAQPHALGVVSSWVRMTADGLPVYQNQGAGGFVHHAVSTMMLRREPVLKSLGYWDAVRFEADSEFMCRLQAVHGKLALLWDDTVTALALSRAGSLTQDPSTGLDDIFGPSHMRQQYRAAWGAWHASGAPLYLGLHPQPRPFAAPVEMLP